MGASKRARFEALREEQFAIAHQRYTETSMSVVRIGVEVGMAKDRIHDWARAHGWQRPPKTCQTQANITPTQYRRRFLDSVGVPTETVPVRNVPGPRKVRDTFDVTSKRSMADARQVLRLHREQTEARVKELWDDGVELLVICQRLTLSKSRARGMLKRAGADLKAPRRGCIGTGRLFSGGMTAKARAGGWQRRT